MTIPTPGLSGNASKKSLMGASPPADAPMPTIGKSSGSCSASLVGSAGFDNSPSPDCRFSPLRRLGGFDAASFFGLETLFLAIPDQTFPIVRVSMALWSWQFPPHPIRLVTTYDRATQLYTYEMAGRK